MTKQAELRKVIRIYVVGLAHSGDNFRTSDKPPAVDESVLKDYEHSFMTLFTTHQKQLLEELLSELPEKYSPEYEKHIDSYQYGCNETIDQVSALIEKKLKEQNQ